ncbi:MAG: type II toxin-antitoxin system PemK/MazF family toxin [Lachnospira sp.]
MKELKKGDIINIELENHGRSSVQSGYRPCVVIGTYPTCPVAIVAPLTTKKKKAHVPVHVELKVDQVLGYLKQDSTILIEQLTTIDRRNIDARKGKIDPESGVMEKIDEALIRQLKIKTA